MNANKLTKSSTSADGSLKRDNLLSEIKSVRKNTSVCSLFLIFGLRIRIFMLIKPVNVDEKPSNQSPAWLHSPVLGCFGWLADRILQMIDQLIDWAFILFFFKLGDKSKNFSFVSAAQRGHLSSVIWGKNDQLQLVTVIKHPLKRCQSAAKIYVSSPR